MDCYSSFEFFSLSNCQCQAVLVKAVVLISGTKKKSLANTLRKRFGRGKDGSRAQSAERIPAYYDSNLLQPPQSLDNTAGTSRVSGD